MAASSTDKLKDHKILTIDKAYSGPANYSFLTWLEFEDGISEQLKGEFSTAVSQVIDWAYERMSAKYGPNVKVFATNSTPPKPFSRMFAFIFANAHMDRETIEATVSPVFTADEKQKESALKAYLKLAIVLPIGLTYFNCKLSLLNIAALANNSALMATLIKFHGTTKDCAPWRYNCPRVPIKKPYLFLFNAYYVAASLKMDWRLLAMMQIYDSSPCFIETKAKNRPPKSETFQLSKLHFLMNSKQRNVVHLSILHYKEHPRFVLFTYMKFINIVSERDSSGKKPVALAIEKEFYAFCHFEALWLCEVHHFDLELVNKAIALFWDQPKGADLKKIFNHVDLHDFEPKYGMYFWFAKFLKYLTPAYGWEKRVITKEDVRYASRALGKVPEQFEIDCNLQWDVDMQLVD